MISTTQKHFYHTHTGVRGLKEIMTVTNSVLNTVLETAGVPVTGGPPILRAAKPIYLLKRRVRSS